MEQEQVNWVGGIQRQYNTYSDNINKYSNNNIYIYICKCPVNCALGSLTPAGPQKIKIPEMSVVLLMDTALLGSGLARLGLARLSLARPSAARLGLGRL